MKFRHVAYVLVALSVVVSQPVWSASVEDVAVTSGKPHKTSHGADGKAAVVVAPDTTTSIAEPAKPVLPEESKASGFSLFKRLFSEKNKDEAKPPAVAPNPARGDAPIISTPAEQVPNTNTPSAPKIPASEKSARDTKPQPAIPAGASVAKVSHSSVSSRGSVDIYLVINNVSKADDAVIGGEAEGGNLVLVTERDGKEVEGPISLSLKAEDSVVLKEGKQFLRLTSGDKKLKNGDNIPVSLYFRRSANAKFTVTLGE